MTTPSELLKQRRFDRAAIALLRKNSEPGFLEDFNSKHLDNPHAALQLKGTLSEAIRLSEESGNSKYVDQATDALSWPDEARYKYFVKARSPEERDALHQKQSQEGIFQSLKRFVSDPVVQLTSGIGMAALGPPDRMEKFVDLGWRCITNTLIQGDTIISQPFFHSNYSNGAAATFTLGALVAARFMQEGIEKGWKAKSEIAHGLAEASNKGFKVADTPSWLKESLKRHSLEDYPLTKVGQEEYKSLVSSESFKNMQDESDRKAAVAIIKMADFDRVAKAFQELPFTAKACSQGIGYGKMVDITDALNGQAAEFTKKTEWEQQHAKREIVRRIAFDTEHAPTMKKTAVEAIGLGGTAVNAVGHTVEAGFESIKRGLAKLRANDSEPTVAAPSRKLPAV